ncbi:MAG: AAA family ATPase [Candidatus Aminicenantes bacterium]|nr:MAG: AAA family ATPase [Candidatus Aminicenantes bacterium]
MGQIIAAIVGMCGTGKSAAANYIQETFKFKPIYFGGFVLEEMKRRNLEINSTNEKIVREDLRQTHGFDVMARRATDKINFYLSAGENVIIDGLYSFSEYLYLKENFGKQLHVIALHSSKRVRYQRLGTRNRRPLTPREVDERDLMEIKNIEKAGPIAIADYHIINDGEMEELYTTIDGIFKELINPSGD